MNGVFRYMKTPPILTQMLVNIPYIEHLGKDEDI